ncbi:MAG: polysaccharide biosynthesis/export family protein [Acetobacteraceae bacterium]
MDTLSGYSEQSPGLRQRLRASRALRRIVVLSAAVALAACTNTGNLPPAPLEPVALGPSAPLPPYRIQVGDVLDLRLLLNPELNEEVTVRPDGHISTTIAGDVVAAGRTIPELDASLRGDYAHDLQNPRISVVVKSFAPTRIYVGGEVNNPGEFITVGPTLTLSQAIARAGGLKLSSEDGSIFIIRRGADDRPEFLSVRYGAIEHAVDPNADVRLAPYDVVYAPKMGIAEVYKFYNQYVQQFINPTFGFSYIVNPAAGAATVITH